MKKTADNPLPGDLRLDMYRSAVKAMREGQYSVDFPVGNLDETGQLGVELQGLADHLEWQFAPARKLQEISDTVSGGLTLDDVLDRVFDSFQTIIPYNRIGCALLTEDGRSLRASWARADFEELRLVTGFTASMANSSLNQIIATGQPRILNDLEDHLARHPGSHSTQLMVSEGIRSSLTCPLVSKGKPVGFLFFSSTERFTYQGIHQGVYLRIASQLSSLIEKGRLYQELVELNARLLATQAELQELATRDALTGIYNRRGILERLSAAFARARREGGQLALILVDVDHFKKINDCFGHSTGDAVLKEIANRLGSHLRQYNHLGRLGGEEFLIVMGDVECTQGTCIAERLRKEIGALPVEHDGRSIAVTISAGVVQAADCTSIKSGEALVAIADDAMYEAKRLGRNRVSCRVLGCEPD
ncbi:GGDEF domain-containing protein [Azoarcus sp. L1K30]|uniref:sensor domain-containing diguanylate cyclase n=1 Tax=Azoarcus sp. L1K30 TaxID=2820277 RepID=UPI001B83FA13|nr:sensor domain-containing diguanylate cyclase [Azoarcus sp. L1K30]MBR0564702.1 GGDEF domain-containing protein [Azoarcus sp. L1K30]